MTRNTQPTDLSQMEFEEPYDTRATTAAHGVRRSAQPEIRHDECTGDIAQRIRGMVNSETRVANFLETQLRENPGQNLEQAVEAVQQRIATTTNHDPVLEGIRQKITGMLNIEASRLGDIVAHNRATSAQAAQHHEVLLKAQTQLNARITALQTPVPGDAVRTDANAAEAEKIQATQVGPLQDTMSKLLNAITANINIQNPYASQPQVDALQKVFNNAISPQFKAIATLPAIINPTNTSATTINIDTAVLATLQKAHKGTESGQMYASLENSVNAVNVALTKVAEMAPRVATPELAKANKKEYEDALKQLETATSSIGRQLNDDSVIPKLNGTAQQINGHAHTIDYADALSAIQTDTAKAGTYATASEVEKYNMRTKELENLKTNQLSQSVALANLSAQLRAAQDFAQENLPTLKNAHTVTLAGSPDKIPELGDNTSRFTVERLGQLCKLSISNWEPNDSSEPNGPGKYVKQELGFKLSREDITAAIAKWNGPEGEKIFAEARKAAQNSNPPQPFPTKYKKIKDHGSYIECNTKAVRNLVLPLLKEAHDLREKYTATQTAAAQASATTSAVPASSSAAPQPYGNPAATAGVKPSTPPIIPASTGSPVGANAQPLPTTAAATPLNLST